MKIPEKEHLSLIQRTSRKAGIEPSRTLWWTVQKKSCMPLLANTYCTLTVNIAHITSLRIAAQAIEHKQKKRREMIVVAGRLFVRRSSGRIWLAEQRLSAASVHVPTHELRACPRASLRFFSALVLGVSGGYAPLLYVYVYLVCVCV